MTRARALLILAAAPRADLVCCSGCDEIVSAPSGVPEGWDAVWSRAAGWSFTCPACLDEIEEAWRSGRPSALGGGLAA